MRATQHALLRIRIVRIVRLRAGSGAVGGYR
jgi:hypothetical protein